MRAPIQAILLAALLALQLATPALAARSALPKGVKLPKDVALPNDTVLAVYLPANELSSRFYVSGLGAWAYPGKALEDARSEVAAQFFPAALPVTVNEGGAIAPGRYGLLLAITPGWDFESGELKLTLDYRVHDPAGAKLLGGTQVQSVALNSAGPLGGFANAARRAMQLVLVDLLVKLGPAAARYPAGGELAAIDRELLIDRKSAASSGTAFYINGAGQMLTAAHVLRDCLVLEAHRDGLTIPVTLSAHSRLLDLAVVSSGKPVEGALPLRRGEAIELGEPVTNVGYPLQGLLASSPNLTRGNVSARDGLKGSVGLFQFSAPIQPGSSGGPVVSDGGELLGVTVSSLNAAALVKEGLLPQNVNFALDARYAAMFLRDAGIEFTEVEPKTDGSMSIANAAALGAVLQLSCYQ